MSHHRATTRIGALFFIIAWSIAALHQPYFAQAKTLSNIAPATGVASSSAVRPIEISIPSIKATIPIINVGLTSTNNLDVPHNFVQAGWYKNGPLPGSPGTAVIDGHVDNGGKHPTIPGVFKNLNKAKVGTTLSVRQSDGTVAHFKVTSTALYQYTKFPSDLVFQQTDRSMLNIITCAGTWLPKDDTYSHRLVVTAERDEPVIVVAER